MDVLCRLRRLLCHSRIINAEMEQRLVNSTITDVEIKESLVNDKIINAEIRAVRFSKEYDFML